MNNKGSLRKTAILLAIGTVISKILGFVREVAVAYKFGAGSITDAFVLTNGIPSMIFVSVGAAIGINYIPSLQKIKNDGEKNEFTSNLLNVILAILSIGCILVEVFPVIVLKFFAAGLPSETERYAIVMLRIVMFSIFPITLSHLFQAYSQTKGTFETTALYGIVCNAVIIVSIFLCTAKTYWLLSVGIIAANVVGFIFVFRGAQKSGFTYKRIFWPFSPDIKSMVILTLPLMIEDIASNMSLLVDRNLASFLESGTLSGLSYAGILGNIAGTLVSAPIITATFPSFVKLLGEGNHKVFENNFEKCAEVILFLMCPVSVILIFFAKDIVIFIFEHGAFHSAASKVVYESMICYSIGIIPSAMQDYFIRAFYAIQDTKTPVKVKVFSLICNIILNLAVVKFLRHIGIALSTSVSLIMAYFLLGALLKKKYSFHCINKITIDMFREIGMALVAGIITFVVFRRFIVIDILFFRLVLEIVSFMISYMVIEVIFNKHIIDEMFDLLKIYKRKSPK